ncbi:MAG: hypothetical protein FWF81_11485, partial [Defluviitaleaceae bacterium]|nr:hypothetical protein [Defluviitaleaceae bacterium]
MKQKRVVMLLFVILGLLMPFATAFASSSSTYVGIEPFMTLQIEMETSADSTLQADGGEVVEVTIWWQRAFIDAVEPVAIWATNDAEVDLSSFSFATYNRDRNLINNGTVSNIVSDGNAIRLTTSAPAMMQSWNRLSFYVTAPIDRNNFTLSIKVGSEGTPNDERNFISRTFSIPGWLTVTTCVAEYDNIVMGSTPFTVFVESGLNLGDMVIIRFVHTESNIAIFDMQTIGELDSNGNLSESVVFPDTAPAGIYLIQVFVICNSSGEPFLADTTVELQRPAPSITLYTSLAVVDVNELFIISGEVHNFDDAYSALVRVIDYNRQLVVREDYTNFFDNGRFSFNPFYFPDRFADGIYYIQGLLLCSDQEMVAFAEITIELRRPLPPSITITAPDTVNANTNFGFTGEVVITCENPSVFWEILNSAGQQVFHGTAIPNAEGEFEVYGLSFNTHPSGLFTLVASLRNAADEELATASHTINRTRNPDFYVRLSPGGQGGTMFADAPFFAFGRVTYPSPVCPMGRPTMQVRI